MIAQGLMIMLVGMGTVFVFLGLLVGLMNLSGSVFSKWPEDKDLALGSEEKGAQSLDEEPLIEIAIALAAIKRRQSI